MIPLAIVGETSTWHTSDEFNTFTVWKIQRNKILKTRIYIYIYNNSYSFVEIGGGGGGDGINHPKISPHSKFVKKSTAEYS